MAKSLFNFYLEDSDKKQAAAKLERLAGETNKGQLASLLRVLLKLFIATPDDRVDKDLIEALYSEYTYSQSKNKRSNL